MADQQGQRARIAPTASAEQTAAIVAALERFWRATSSPPRSTAKTDPWLRAAVLEGVSRQPRAGVLDPWINT
jgi:hypothetical protein